MASACLVRSVPVRNAKRAAEIALNYVEEVLRRGDLVIEEVEEDEDEQEWLVRLEGLAQEYELRIDADSGDILEMKRV
jgi:uncharacterized membrane protein YkoI